LVVCFACIVLRRGPYSIADAATDGMLARVDRRQAQVKGVVPVHEQHSVWSVTVAQPAHQDDGRQLNRKVEAWCCKPSRIVAYPATRLEVA
jgi:hypothetical protein